MRTIGNYNMFLRSIRADLNVLASSYNYDFDKKVKEYDVDPSSVAFIVNHGTVKDVSASYATTSWKWVAPTSDDYIESLGKEMYVNFHCDVSPKQKIEDMIKKQEPALLNTPAIEKRNKYRAVKGRKRWSKEEDNYVKAHIDFSNFADSLRSIAEHLDRTSSSIRNRLDFLGLLKDPVKIKTGHGIFKSRSPKNLDKGKEFKVSFFWGLFSYSKKT